MATATRILYNHRPPVKANRIQRLDGRQNPFTGIPWENWINAALVDPKITLLAPATLPATAAATTITVTGTGFGSGSIVEADGVALATTFVSSTSLTAPFDPSVAGTVTFTVRNASGMESNDFAMVITATSEDPVADDQEVEEAPCPTTHWKKADIIEWLVAEGGYEEEGLDGYTKAELLDLVEE